MICYACREMEATCTEKYEANYKEITKYYCTKCFKERND